MARPQPSTPQLVGLIAMAIFAAVGTFGVAVGDLFSLQPGTFP